LNKKRGSPKSGDEIIFHVFPSEWQFLGVYIPFWTNWVDPKVTSPFFRVCQFFPFLRRESKMAVRIRVSERVGISCVLDRFTKI
jgi:hypothetical protein